MKNLSPTWEPWVRSLGGEDPLGKAWQSTRNLELHQQILSDVSILEIWNLLKAFSFQWEDLDAELWLISVNFSS